MPELACQTCGSKKEVPRCCDKSMIVKDDYLLCCCSETCDYRPIPMCCGKKMGYV